MRRPGSVAKIIVVTSSMLVVSACSALSGNAGGDATPPPKALTAQEYSTTLTTSIGALDSALKRLATASAYKGLDDRVGAVETAANQAVTALQPIVPPTELAEKHTQLVTALQAFEGELGELSEKVNDRALCTGSTTRASLGDAEATAALGTALAAVSAQLPKSKLALTLPAADQKDGSRPSNGKLVRAGTLDGEGQLTIDNGGSADAVVTLSKGRKPTVAVYVRKGKAYTVKGLPDGTYAVFFTGGSAWDGKARAFGRNCAFKRFEKSLGYRTTRTSIQILYQTYTLTLKPVVGGNAKTADVDPNEFPSP